MQFFNRFTIFTKRILIKKIYLIMLISLIFLTAIYVILPAKSQSTDIKIGIYCEDNVEYYTQTLNLLSEKNSIYSFYIVPSKDDLINDVNSQKAECGYYIPEGFFKAYIEGNASDSPIIQYVTPASILASAVNETLYSVIMQACSPEILTYSVDIPEYNDELTSSLETYMNSDEIFTISDVADGTLNHKTYEYKIDIPIYELSLILILTSGLMGLLLYYEDMEKGLYTPLSKKAKFGIKLISITTAILPILLVGCVASSIVAGSLEVFAALGIYALIILGFSILLSIIVRKSKQLATIIPLILLISVIGSFAYSII